MPEPDGAALWLAFSADPLSVRAGLARVMAAAPLDGLGPEARTTVEIVLAEVLNNIAEHAYAGGPGQVAVDLRQQGAVLSVLISDRGVAMPGNQAPAGKPLNLAGLTLSELPEGGFGWSMIRSLTRGLTYQRDGDWNRLGFVIPLHR